MATVNIYSFVNNQTYRGWVITPEDEFEVEFRAKYIGDDMYLIPLTEGFDEIGKVFIDGLVAYPESKSGENLMYLVERDDELGDLLFHMYQLGDLNKSVPPSTQKQRIIVEGNKSLLSLRFTRNIKGFFIDVNSFGWGYVVYQYSEWGSTYDKSPTIRPVMGEISTPTYPTPMTNEGICREGGILHFLSDNPEYIKEVAHLFKDGLVDITLKPEIILEQICGWEILHQRWLAKKACRHMDVWIGGGRRG